MLLSFRIKDILPNNFKEVTPKMVPDGQRSCSIVNPQSEIRPAGGGSIVFFHFTTGFRKNDKKLEDFSMFVKYCRMRKKS